MSFCSFYSTGTGNEITVNEKHCHGHLHHTHHFAQRIRQERSAAVQRITRLRKKHKNILQFMQTIMDVFNQMHVLNKLTGTDYTKRAQQRLRLGIKPFQGHHVVYLPGMRRLKHHIKIHHG